MYGRKKYNQSRKLEQLAVPSVPSNNIPNYVCNKCKQIKFLPPKDTQIQIVLVNEKESKMLYRICGSCAERLKNWIKGS